MHYFNSELIDDLFGLKITKRKTFEFIVGLICLEIALAFSYFGYIGISPVPLTTLHILVVIAALYFGPLGAVIISTVFSLTSMWIATTSTAETVYTALSPFISGRPFASIVVCFGVRTLFALVAALAFRVYFRYHRYNSHKKNSIAIMMIAALSSAFYGISMWLAMYKLFPDTLDAIDASAAVLMISNGLMYIFTGWFVVLTYQILINPAINRTFVIINGYDELPKERKKRQLALLSAGIVAFMFIIYMYLISHYYDELNMLQLADGLTEKLITLSLPIILQTLIAFVCMLVFVYLLLYWINTYNTYLAYKANEEARVAAVEASRSKTSFLFNMSHDIRTPMNAVSGYTAMAKKHINDSAAVEEYLSKIEISSKVLLDIINDVLDVGRIESGNIRINPYPFNVVECAAEVGMVFTQLAASKNIDFGCELNYDPNIYIYADQQHLKQVIMNILSNAIKYTPEGGKVTAKLEQLEDEDPNYLGCRYTVEDNGIGMSPEFLKKVFDPYSRDTNKKTKSIQGTGLGMYIVKSLVDLLGGKINIESEEGKGTTITVQYRFRKCTEEEIAEAKKDEVEEKEEFNLKGCYILLVDDNDMNREIASDILSDYDVEIVEATNGREAVEAVRKSLEPDGRMFDIILMDVQMPLLNGYEATKQIRALPNLHDRYLPIIAMTANAFEEDVRSSIESGMDAHLSKPVDINKLLDTMETLTRKQH